MVSLKSIFRIMWAAKRLHILNMLGLAVGLCVVLLISLYIKTELSFDKHIDNYQNKYRLLQVGEGVPVAIFPYAASDLIQNDIPGIASFCMVDNENGSITVDNNNYMLENVLASDQIFVDMFGLQIINTHGSMLLNEPNTCIISESTAYKLFGDEPPIGKSINFYKTFDCVVSAVYADLPESSHLKADIVISRASWNAIGWKKRYFESWGMQGTNFYVTLNADVRPDLVKENIRNAFYENAPWFQHEKAQANPEEFRTNYDIRLQAMEDIHLHSSDVQWDIMTVKNNINTIKAFAIVMVLVLFLACFNYVNLSTANSEAKKRITKILATLGAKRQQVFSFNLVQTLLTVFLAFLFAFLLVALILPYFEGLVNLKLQYNWYFSPEAILYISFIFAFIIGVAGIYPALFFSSGLSEEIIGQKKQISKSKSTILLRPMLVTAQFIIAIFLLVSIFSVREQVLLLTSKELGFDKEQLLEIQFYKDKKNYDFIAQEFLNLANVSSVTAASNMPCEYINNSNSLYLVGGENTNPPNGCIVGIESNYFEVMETRIVEGENFKPEQKSNEDYVLVNETTVSLLNLDEPIGTKLKLMGKEYLVLGVVEDIQYRTLHEPSLPVLYSANYSNYQKIAVKLNAGNHIETLAQIKNIWESKYPDDPIRINFFDTKLEKNYKVEISQLKLFNLLVIISGFIVILGMIGLIRFITDQKTKEIGIRKVNGAKVSEILAMLNKDFVKWVVIAFVIACPVAYFAMNKWLENFAYKTTLSWWIFALAGVFSLGVALLTVSWQSWRAAIRNPVEALRYE